MIKSFELLGDSSGRNHFNHVVVDKNQVAYISNTLKSRIEFIDTRLSNKTIKPLVEDSKMEMIHGLSLSEDEKMIFFTSYSNGIQSYDIDSKKISQLSDRSENHNDGLIYKSGNLYGVGQNLIKRYRLNKEETQIIKDTTLVKDHNKFNDPRCLQLVDDTLYCLANIETEPVVFRRRNVKPQDKPLGDSYLIKMKLK